VGRTDDVIMTGGEKVSPMEVELVLTEHPLVKDAVVLGVENEEWGEAVVAVVVPANLNDIPEVDQMRAYLRDRLAGFKVPKDIVLAAAIPRTANGKVDVQALRALLGL
jgi:acyl-CoA synthetase (AMP-forming)/AMP-acid ligase II